MGGWIAAGSAFLRSLCEDPLRLRVPSSGRRAPLRGSSLGEGAGRKCRGELQLWRVLLPVQGSSSIHCILTVRGLDMAEVDGWKLLYKLRKPHHSPAPSFSSWHGYHHQSSARRLCGGESSAHSRCTHAAAQTGGPGSSFWIWHDGPDVWSTDHKRAPEGNSLLRDGIFAPCSGPFHPDRQAELRGRNQRSSGRGSRPCGGPGRSRGGGGECRTGQSGGA